MHSPVVWLSICLATGLCCAAFQWQAFASAAAILGVAVSIVQYAMARRAVRRFWCVRVGDPEESVICKPQNVTRARKSAILLPLLAGCCLWAGSVIGQAHLQGREIASSWLQASQTAGAVLTTGTLSGPLERVGRHVEVPFRVSGVYTSAGLRLLPEIATVWLEITLPKVQQQETGRTVLRSYVMAQHLRPGDRIMDYVFFSRVPPGPFATALRRRGILVIGRSSIYGVTKPSGIAPTNFDIWTWYGRALADVEAHVQRAYGASAAAWLLSIGLGDHVSLDTKVIQTLAGIGAVHALIASGATINMTIAPIIHRLRRRSPNYAALWYPLGVLSLIALLTMTGLALPALRAGIAYFYRLTGAACGIRTNRIVANVLALDVITLFQPDAILDPGVLLSFAAAFILSPLAKVVESLLPNRLPSVVRRVAARGFAAELGVTPLIAVLFEQFSMVSLLVNLFLYPLLEAAIPFSMVLLAGSYLTWPGEKWLAEGLTFAADGLTSAILYLQHFPLVLHLPQVTYFEILVYFIALGSGAHAMRRYGSRPRSQYL
ncbi:MAG: ComEC/Rec2 family competence protein [Firmicutes bacterium]|nr:ComEC/Rec2 family competence protein [Bacillota bacterium]